MFATASRIVVSACPKYRPVVIFSSEIPTILTGNALIRSISLVFSEIRFVRCRIRRDLPVATNSPSLRRYHFFAAPRLFSVFIINDFTIFDNIIDNGNKMCDNGIAKR